MVIVSWVILQLDPWVNKTETTATAGMLETACQGSGTLVEFFTWLLSLFYQSFFI